MRRRCFSTGSPSPQQADADLHLLALFHELDEDGNGSLTVSEICQALKSNTEFAKLIGVEASADQPMSQLAAYDCSP